MSLRVINRSGFTLEAHTNIANFSHDPVFDAGMNPGHTWFYSYPIMTALTCRLAGIPFKVRTNGASTDTDLISYGVERDGVRYGEIALVTPHLQETQQFVVDSLETRIDPIQVSEKFTLDLIELLRAPRGPFEGRQIPDDNSFDLSVGDQLYQQDNQGRYVELDYYFDSEAQRIRINGLIFHDGGNSLTASADAYHLLMKLIWTPESHYNFGLESYGERGLPAAEFIEKPMVKLTYNGSTAGIRLVNQQHNQQAPSEVVTLNSPCAAALVFNAVKQLAVAKSYVPTQVEGGSVDLTPVLNAISGVSQQVQGVDTTVAQTNTKAESIEGKVDVLSGAVEETTTIAATIPNRCDIIYTATQLILALVVREYSGSPRKVANLMHNIIDEYVGSTDVAKLSRIQDIPDSPFRLYQDLVDEHGNLKKPGQNQGDSHD